MSTPAGSWRPVSYTHLDVYKRQIFHRVDTGTLQAVEGTHAQIIDDEQGVTLVSACLLYTSTTFAGSVNTYDVLNADKLIISVDAAKKLEEVLG